MAINLAKGQRVDLTKNNAGLNNILVGLGWDPIKQKGLFGLFKSSNMDLDASVFALKGDKLLDKKDIIYFGNLKSENGSIKHTGDNLTGDGAGDDEQILVSLKSVPSEVNRLVFVINIYHCKERKQDFGMVNNAYIRVVDNSNGTELVRYNLSEDYSGKTGMIVGEVYRSGSDWKFAAIGEGTYDTGINDMIKKYR